MYRKAVMALLLVGSLGVGSISTLNANASDGGFFVAKSTKSAPKNKSKAAKIISSKKLAKRAVRANYGNIYASAKLTKVTHNMKNYTHTTFYRTKQATVIKSNGNKAVYQYLKTANGKVKGWVWRGYVSKVKIPPKWTAEQKKTISQFKADYKKLGNTTKNMYAKKPGLTKKFATGQLSQTYLNQTTAWINFYRHLYGLAPVTTTAANNQSAQYGAAALAAADDGLSHGLVGFKKPKIMSQSDWEKGIEATENSNLAQGSISPKSVIEGYLFDPGNPVPGHRAWLLSGGIKTIGIGQAGEYNALQVINDDGDWHGNQSVIPYPAAGAFPSEMAKGAGWSIFIPGETEQVTSISVHDDTANKAVKVSHLLQDNDSYGYYGNVTSYDVKSKENHQYTITVKGLSAYPNGYKYTTILFK